MCVCGRAGLRVSLVLVKAQACSQEGWLLLSVVINNTLRFHIGARSLNFSGHKFNDLFFGKNITKNLIFKKISKSLFIER
jgi:hypothetical protein